MPDEVIAGVPAGAESVDVPDTSGPDTGSMTDDEIFALPSAESQSGEAPAEEGEDGDPAVPATPVVQPPKEGQEEKPADQTPPAEEPKPDDVEQWIDPKDVPEAFGPIFKKHADLKAAFYRDKAVGKMFPGGFSEVREFHSLFPNLQDAKETVGLAETALTWKGATRTPEEFVRFVGQTAPAGLEALVKGFPDSVGKMAPQHYRMLSEPIMRNVFDSYERFARERGDEDAIDRVMQMRAELGLAKPSDQTAPSNDPRIRAYEQWQKGEDSRKAQAASQRQEAYDRFGADVVRTHVGGLQTQIAKEIDGLNSTFTEAAKQRIAKEVLQGVNEQLGKSRMFRGLLEQKFQGGNLDDKHQAEVVAWLMGRTAFLASQETRRVVTEYSRDVFASDTKARDRKMKSAQQRDPGATNPSHGTPQTGAGAPSRPQRSGIRRGVPASEEPW